MTNKQKWKYLVNALPKSGKPYEIEILQEFFFGKNQSIQICAEKAYKDIQRNLSGIGKLSDNKKEDYKSAVYDCITNAITELPKRVSKDEQTEFDKWHLETCDEIISISEKMLNDVLEEKFCYGLAQKWLNMTLKNMLVAKLEGIFIKVNGLYPLFHVPVDQYILRAAYYQLGIRDIDGEKGKLILNRYGEPTKNKKKLPWSKWKEYKDYIEFQYKIRKMIDSRDDYKYPIDWEFDAWISGVS